MKENISNHEKIMYPVTQISRKKTVEQFERLK